MTAGSDQWQKNLQALAIELRSVPSAASQADQLRKLMVDWQRSRASLDQDFMVQVSFFLGSLSSQVKDPRINALIQDLMQHRSPGSASTAAPKPPASHPQSDAGRVEEEFIDFDHPDESSPSFITRPSPPPSRKAPVGGSDPLASRGENRKDSLDTEHGDDVEYPNVDRRVNSAYRLHLNRKHGEIEKLQELLAQKASEALSQNKQFGDLLKTERAALEQASDLHDINEMKNILIGSADELLAGQKDLEDKLKSSFEYLEVVKSDSENLHNELTKVRLLSLTDENTGLPNRRAFLRRLEDELHRARQYNIPLTMGLIDLDFFKEINDQYGHPAGDAVLRWYAQHGLPIFRHYDMIARYGGEEFAVLFPGTTAEGAGRAVAKLREHVARKTCLYEDEVINIPTFSAGLATFRDDEDEESLIKRADQALYRAKSMGRNQTAVKLTFSVTCQ